MPYFSLNYIEGFRNSYYTHQSDSLIMYPFYSHIWSASYSPLCWMKLGFICGKIYLIYMQCHDFLNHMQHMVSTHSFNCYFRSWIYHYIMLWIIESINLVPFSHLAVALCSMGDWYETIYTTGPSPSRGLEPGFSKFDDLNVVVYVTKATREKKNQHERDIERHYD